MITLITGLPGNGKTLYALTWLKDRAVKENRQVYFHGIKDCQVPGWIELEDPKTWHTLPPGAIIVIDEVQTVMRPRMHGTTVPEFVAKLETHRHQGFDLVLITQNPMLLDSNARRLVGQHFHVVRKFGTKMATVHEWNGVKENCDKNREDSIRHDFRYPVASFALYKSAELHTHKRRIPFKVWVFLALPFILVALAWAGWSKVTNKPAVDSAAARPGAMNLAAPGGVGSPAAAARPGQTMTTGDYLAAQVPRVAGLAYTAPAYDEITKPVEAPYPAACVEMRGECKCYTQQGTRLDVGLQLCRSIVRDGFFMAWKPPSTIAPVVQPAPVLAQADTSANAGAPMVAIGSTGYGLAARNAPAPATADLPSQGNEPPQTTPASRARLANPAGAPG
jgi:zona occludens toxin